MTGTDRGRVEHAEKSMRELPSGLTEATCLCGASWMSWAPGTARAHLRLHVREALDA